MFFEWLCSRRASSLSSSLDALMRGADDHPLFFGPSCRIEQLMGLTFLKGRTKVMARLEWKWDGS